MFDSYPKPPKMATRRPGGAQWKTTTRLALSAGALLILSASGALAQRIDVTINGDPVVFKDVGPLGIQGRVMVPVRGVLEKLGAQVAWIPQTHSVIASNADIDIELQIGNRQATVNGKTVMMDVPAQAIEGHTMVPLRFLSEALGAEVRWDGQTHTVLITTKDRARAPRLPGDTRPDRTGDTRPDRAVVPPVRSNVTPTIQSFAHDGKGWLRAGEMLHITLQGTPGGQAVFHIPGLTGDVPMREEAPGRYVGVWQAPVNKPIQLSSAAVIGNLSLNGNASPLIQAGQTLAVDTIPPRLRDRSPESGARVTVRRPSIYAVFDDQGSGVDRDSIRLLLNGQDVTAQATVTRDFISYTPSAPLPVGPQTVQIIHADRAGNRVTTAWRFTEEPTDSVGIKSLSDNVRGVLEPGDTLHVEMTGAPGGKASFSLGSIKNVVMAENAPGHYVTDYTIRKGDDVANTRMAARLLLPNGDHFEHQADRAVTVSTGKPMDPVITSPGPNDRIADPLVIKGKGTPNTKVHIRVDYRNRVLGQFALQGTAADVVVTVGKDGLWQTEPLSLKTLFSGRNMEYTLSATSENAAQEKSDTTALRLRLR